MPTYVFVGFRRYRLKVDAPTEDLARSIAHRTSIGVEGWRTAGDPQHPIEDVELEDVEEEGRGA